MRRATRDPEAKDGKTQREVRLPAEKAELIYLLALAVREYGQSGKGGQRELVIPVRRFYENRFGQTLEYGQDPLTGNLVITLVDFDPGKPAAGADGCAAAEGVHPRDEIADPRAGEGVN